VTGAWVLKFPKLRLVVTLKEGSHLVAGEDIDKGETVRVENVCTGVFPIPKFFFFLHLITAAGCDTNSPVDLRLYYRSFKALLLRQAVTRTRPLI
jgi:hypothetical protein